MTDVIMVVAIISAVSIGGGIYYWLKRDDDWEAVIESVEEYDQKRGYGEMKGVKKKRYKIVYVRNDGVRGEYDLSALSFRAAGQDIPNAGDRIVKRKGEAGPVIEAGS